MSRASVWNVIGALAILLGLVSAPHAAMATPTLQVNGSGILTGVNDVLVGSSLYDVSFGSPGHCASVFGVCDAAHFTFHASSDAIAASGALLAAIDAPSDFDETKIYGCGSTDFCYAITPYSTSLTGFFYGVEVDSGITGTGVDYAGSSFLPFSFFNSGHGVATWAVWSPDLSTASVPEPPTETMLGLGLLALVFLRRRKVNIEPS